MKSMPSDQSYRSVSFWLDTVPGSLAPGEVLPGDLAVDVAIAGAGLTGLWTAYYLAARAARPAGRRVRGAGRRVRRVRAQRRLVFRAVPRVAGRS